MAREKVEFDVVGRDSGGSKVFKQVGDAADKAADQVEGLGKQSTVAGEEVKGLGDKAKRSGKEADEAGDQYRGLAADIAVAEAAMKALAAEINRTGNKDLLKDLNRQRSEMRKLTKVKDLLPDLGGAGGQAAESFSVQFAQKVGPLLARVPMGPAGAAIGAAIAVPVVAILGTAVSGAIVGGVGIGGVIGGLKIAAGDSRVQAAGKGLSDAVMGDLEASGARFVEPALAGIGIIRSAWNDVSGTVDGVFEATAGYVEPLARGLADAVREIAPGFRDAAVAAQPIVAVLRDELPEFGAVISDALSSLAGDADEGASAIRLMFQAMGDGVDTAAALAHGFAEVYRVILDVADAGVTADEILLGWNPLFSDRIEEGRRRVDELKAGLDKGGDAGTEAGTKIEGGLIKVDTAAGGATVTVETLRDAMTRLTGDNISAEQANIRLEQAIQRATDAGKANDAGISAHTPKAVENRAALVGIAEAANASAEAIFKQTGNQDLASAATTRGRAKFLETAHAMHVGKDQAIALADKLFAIPTKRHTDITVTANVQPALNSAQGLVARINNMKARIGVGAYGNGAYGGSAHTGQGNSTGERWGGAYEHAQTGLVRLRDAGIYTAAAPARYAFAEPATKGEAFIPKSGDPKRSMQILDQAASWYGAAVVPAGGGGGARSTARASGGGGTDAATLATALARALSGMTLVLDDRTGRTAQLMTRGVV